MEVAPRIGRFGIWQDRTTLKRSTYPLIEQLGFGALWVGNDPQQDLRLVEEILQATERLVVGTSVIPAHRITATTLAASYHRVQGRFPDRTLVGIGAGQLPFDALAGLIAALLELGVPREHLVVGALGERSIRLAGDRTAGVQPYLVTPEHTRLARGWLGAGPLLAPEQRVVVGGAARDFAAAVDGVRMYPSYRPFRRMLTQLGYGAELEHGGSERLHRDLVISGDDGEIRRRLGRHLAAGADHVAIDVVKRRGFSLDDDYAHLADVVLASD